MFRTKTLRAFFCLAPLLVIDSQYTRSILLSNSHFLVANSAVIWLNCLETLAYFMPTIISIKRPTVLRMKLPNLNVSMFLYIQPAQFFVLAVWYPNQSKLLKVSVSLETRHELSNYVTSVLGKKYA